MKQARTKNKRQAEPRVESAGKPGSLRALPVAIAVAALFIALLAYSPALSGPFVLDDLYNPYGQTNAEVIFHRSLQGTRPVLMLSFWANYIVSGAEPFPYHLTNVLLHVGVCALVFFIARLLANRTAAAARQASILAMIAAAFMLVHPLHTEAVAYVASRSDVLCTLFSCAAVAWLVFRQDQPAGMSAFDIALVVLCLILALLTKEQAVALPVMLLLTDYFWNPGGIRRNWRLHMVVASLGAAGLAYLLFRLRGATTAGFSMTQITPIDYFFTQCRALWRYLLLIVVPVGQNLDPDFPLSHGILDHGSLFGLIGLLGLTVAAWVFRRRYPLAAFGWLSFLILIAPTSSFAPILDPVAERRLYFPFLGIVCILLEALRRLQWNQAAMSAAVAVLAVLSLATHFRSQLWASELALWRDTVEKSPGKYRPRFQLAHALYQQGQCDVALREYALASKLAKPDAQLLVDWAHAADCAGRPEDAVAHARKALELEQSAHLYAALGMFEAKRGHLDEAMAALDLAAAKDPGFAMTFVYRGNVYASRSDWSKAAADYRRALQIDPVNQGALHGLRLVREQGHQ